MGTGESKTRKVSFGVDDEDRVRILRGVKLSEDVLQRMKGVANIAPERKPSTNSQSQKDTGASSPRPQQNEQNQAQQKSPSNNNNKSTSFTKEDQKRFERQQAKLKEDLMREAQRVSEATREEKIKALSRERHMKRQEVERVKQLSADEIEVMAQQLQKKDSQLKALDAFYKEQLALLEKRNLERYERSKEQFHQAASETEKNVMSRNTQPVCGSLQAQILSCYRVNSDQTLKCSDLAKEYMRCIDAAKKSMLVNHG